MSNLLKIVASILGCLIVADIVGVIVCLVLDLGAGRSWSAALTYVVWFVIGVFTGLFAFNLAGTLTAADANREWTELPDASRRSAIIVGAAIVLLVALSVVFYALYWSRGVAGEYFVPDSAPHTIVFFVSVGASMLFFRSALTPPRRGAR